MNITLAQYSCPFAPWRPADGRVFEFFAYDTETTAIYEERPYLTPVYVLGAACDGQRGVFLSRENLLPFFQAHRGVPLICHNAAFDLRVTDAMLRPTIDVYQAVDDHQVWDTLILNRLHSLATAGHTARGSSKLAACALTYLGVVLEKDQVDSRGIDVRRGFGQFLGRPPSEIPTEYLAYLARDPLATWHLFWELHRRVKEVLGRSRRVWGYVDDNWLTDVVRRFGPLTHHVQLRASILTDVLTANGIAIDAARRQEKADQVRAVRDDYCERLRRAGYLPGQKGSNKALQSVLNEFRRKHPDVEMHRNPSGKGWSTAEEHLLELTGEDEFFANLVRYRAADKLLSTYLSKMERPRLHARFGYLLETGRTYCGGGFNVQNLPREKDARDVAATIRGCFVPADGHVFIDCDYSQIELVVLGCVLQRQFGLRPELARLINSGQDVHRLIAAAVLGKPAAEVLKPERDSAKPVSFGRPGGMGVNRLRQVAKASYGIDLTPEEVQERIRAYHRLCPELDTFLTDEVDVGQFLAERLGLTPARYDEAVGRRSRGADPADHRPAGWLGGMLLKVLRDEAPVTHRGQGRSYTPQEIDFYWRAAQPLADYLGDEEAAALANREPAGALWAAARDWAGRRSVFTVTGRLRADTTFCSARNCVFQGPAADGAILGLWRVWRAGYRVVDFVHDQVVVESRKDDDAPARAEDVGRLMREGMQQVVPGMRVAVETVVTCSLNKKEVVAGHGAGSQAEAAKPAAGG
jgi:hypothetical protein